ncbi:MAG: SAM-dependent methyltransferase [Actinomycetota bacterium]
MARREALRKRLTRLDPPLSADDAAEALAEHRVLVDGAVVTNPASQVRPDASVVVRPRTVLQGVRKLTPALEHFAVATAGVTALDLGACTGGFTQALLDAGATRVFSVDVGFGQLLGSLRQDDRVVNLERTNVAEVTPDLLGTRPDLIVCDVTKLALRDVGRQLATNDVPRAGTDFLGLVKPMFELATGALPTDDAELQRAVDVAREGLTEVGWDVLGSMPSVITGHRGAVEFVLHSRWPET